MARILVTSLPFAGHVGPMTAVAAELTRRGHEVVAYSGARYRQRFVAAGAAWLPWNFATDFDDSDLAATFPQVGDGKGLRAGKANVEHVLFGTGAGQAADILAEVKREPFDLLVADQLAFGAALAGEVLGTPWATVALTPLSITSRDLPPPGIPVSPATGQLGRVRDAVLRSLVRPMYQRIVDPMLNAMRASVGLGPAPAGGGFDSLYSPYLVVAQGVPGLEYPRGDLPSHVHFVRRLAPAAAPGMSDPAVQLAPWWPELAAARAEGRPVVHVTQGTLPHDLLLPMVDVMVTNGGWGGVLAAVQAGVPLVVAGGSLDKPEVARRVAWSGVGVNLRSGRPGARTVCRAVRQVLSRPQLRQRVSELAVTLTAAGGADTAGTLVEGLLRA